jgi:hypothetical protein
MGRDREVGQRERDRGRDIGEETGGKRQRGETERRDRGEETEG